MSAEKRIAKEKEFVPDPGQKKSRGGGFTFTVAAEKQLERFLILGTSTGTYYTDKTVLTEENTTIIAELIRDDGPVVVGIIEDVAKHGRALKKDTLCYGLALCLKHGDEETKKAATEILETVCGIPTLLFQFVQYCKDLKVGFGRRWRAAVGNWYTRRDPFAIAYQLTKYVSRGGWSNRDVLRLAHPKPINDEIDLILRYIVEGPTGIGIQPVVAEIVSDNVDVAVGKMEIEDKSTEKLKRKGRETTDESMYQKKKRRKDKTVPIDTSDLDTNTRALFEFFVDLEKLKSLEKDDAEEGAAMLRLRTKMKPSFAREHVPTSLLKSRAVWDALLANMPMMATVRNLGKLSGVGSIGTADDEAKSRLDILVNKLKDSSALKAARIHPFSLFLARQAYITGKGKSGANWPVLDMISNALNDGFYAAFGNIEPTNKRFFVGLDVSGSMSYYSPIPNVNCAQASAVMSMVIARSEPNCRFFKFSTTFFEAHITPRMSFEQVLDDFDAPFGGTDCALPMKHCIQNRIPVDVFVIFTDCETNANSEAPHIALQRYREVMGIVDAKLVVCAMASSPSTIASPTDPYMIDVVGLDASLPELLRTAALM